MKFLGIGLFGLISIGLFPASSFAEPADCSQKRLQYSKEEKQCSVDYQTHKTYPKYKKCVDAVNKKREEAKAAGCDM